MSANITWLGKYTYIDHDNNCIVTRMADGSSMTGMAESLPLNDLVALGDAIKNHGEFIANHIWEDERHKLFIAAHPEVYNHD